MTPTTITTATQTTLATPPPRVLRSWDSIGVGGKHFAWSLLAVAVALAIGGAVAEARLGRMSDERTERELGRIAATTAVALAMANLDAAALDDTADTLGRASGVRVTLVRADGVVVGDSDVDASGLARLENHGARPEIVDAGRGGQGVARRHSATTHEEFLYLARPATLAGQPGFLRVALPLVDVDGALHAQRWVFASAAAVSLFIAALGTGFSARHVARRLREVVLRARRGRVVGDAGDDATAGGDDVDDLHRTFDALTDELHRGLQALVDERDRYDAMLKAMGEGVIAIDEAGVVVVANPAALSLLRVQGPLVGSRFTAASLGTLVDEARAGRAGSEEIELDAGGERAARVLVRATPKASRSGGDAGPRPVVLVLHDMTDVRRLEALRRDFVANVSHELRTPCSVILANTETLLTGALDDRPRALKFTEAVHRNAERLSRLIADLLELSKIEAGKVVFTRVPVNVRDAIEHVVDAVEPRAREKQLRVDVDVDDALAIEGDPRALDQVLINLIDNAVKYTPAGGHVVVSAHATEGHALVVVEDDGPGVEEKHKGRLFERFYRVDPGRSRDVGGTGLGLAIVKHLVEAMGGRVRIEDAVPHGTRFCVTLPASGASSSRAA